SLPNEMARPRCVLAMTVGGASRSASLPDEHGATPFLKLPSCHGAWHLLAPCTIPTAGEMV
ncbi:MAG: hypothetical protein ACK48C_05680, partial [Roseiflexaceae bacterium]